MAKAQRTPLSRTEQASAGEAKPDAASQAKRRRKRLAPTAVVHATFRHLKPSAAIQGYAERKLSRVTKFVKQDAAVHLVLSVDKYRHCGEATVKAGRLTVKTAYKEGRDLYAVIDALADKVKRQIAEHAGKIKQSRTRALPASTLLGAHAASGPEAEGEQ